MLDNVKSFKAYLNSLLPDGFNGYIEIFHQDGEIANGGTLLRNLISEFGLSDQVVEGLSNRFTKTDTIADVKRSIQKNCNFPEDGVKFFDNHDSELHGSNLIGNIK